MQKYNILPALLAVLLAVLSAAAVADEKTVSYTVHDFMEAYTKPARDLAKDGDEEPLLRILAIVPAMALMEDQESWQSVIDRAMDADRPLASCRACHRRNKRSYGRAHRDRLVHVPADLVEYLQSRLGT